MQLFLTRLCIGCIGIILCYTIVLYKQDTKSQSSTEATDFSAIMRQRREVVKKECEKLQLAGKQRSSYIVPENFLTVPRLVGQLSNMKDDNINLTRYNLTWCPLYKAGSSNWMRNFVVLAELDTGNSSHLARLALDHLTHTYPDTMDNLRNTMKLLIVRDPWERLLSAYRDKLEVGNTADQQAFQESYGKDMVAKYRREGLERFGEGFYELNLGAPVAVRGRTLNEPTFWEFVQAIIREGVNDRHWNPYHLHCNLCHVQFDYIVKLENIVEEERELFKLLGIDNLLSSQWTNR